MSWRFLDFGGPIVDAYDALLVGRRLRLHLFPSRRGGRLHAPALLQNFLHLCV